MSVESLQNALQEVGLSKAVSQKAVNSILTAIEYELALRGKFTLRGIGYLELVANNRPSTPRGALRTGKRLTSTPAHKGLPVRVRFSTSKVLQKKIALAYGVGVGIAKK